MLSITRPLIFALTGLIGFCVSGCAKSPPGIAPVSDDSYCEHILRIDRNQAEALSWMQVKDGRKHTVGDGSDNLSAVDSLKLVRQLYQAGAVKVTAVDIETDAHSSSSETLIIQIPTTKAFRVKLLKIVNDIETSNGYDLEPDSNQHYLMIHW